MLDNPQYLCAIAEELTKHGHPLSPRTVASRLKADDYRLQSNRKTTEGKQYPDRNEQFEYINRQSLRFMGRGEPVVSVDTKKKELVWIFANKGREWRPKGKLGEVLVHDFTDNELGKAIPYGVYEVKENEGWVSVGIEHDTAGFAAEALWRWWQKMGRKRYGGAKKILIMADGGGSNGSWSRLWKTALQGMANKTGLVIQVCHFLPGTST
jgi:hypothetical protein